MYTSYIGKKFLSLYKEKENKPDDYSARQFFDDVLFPCFFNHETHLMHVHGSTFFQSVGKNDLQNGQTESNFRLNRLHKDIENRKFSGSTIVGFAAGKIDQPTSGQLTSINFIINEEEAYASWIGEGLAIGVNGGLMLFSEPEILWALFKGWEQYRKYIEQTPNIKGRQIETWNGHWLSHYFNQHLYEQEDSLNFELPIGNNDGDKGTLSISTQKWVKIIFLLSKMFPNRVVNCHCYFLGKTNTTFGFINIYIPEVKYLYEFRDKFFLNKNELILEDKEIEQLETFYNFKDACKFGTIGLKALEPSKLREFMPKGTVEYAQGKDFKFTDENSKYIFSLYKLWIIAMLNKTELLQLAADVAKSLHSLEREQSDNNRGKTTQTQSSRELLESKSLKVFIDGLTENINENNAQTFKNVVDNVVKMPSDNFPLFITLIRFEYSYQKNNSSHQTN